MGGHTTIFNYMMFSGLTITISYWSEKQNPPLGVWYWSVKWCLWYIVQQNEDIDNKIIFICKIYTCAVEAVY